MSFNCPHCCGPLSTAGKCPICDPVTTITITPNITYTWICPKCGSHCSMYGFCQSCGWWAVPPQPTPTGWRCPGCGRYHGPHINTCPFCQPTVAPRPVVPYISDSPYIYIGDPPYWHNTCTIGTNNDDISKHIYVGDPPGSCSCDSVSSTEIEGIRVSLS